MHRVKQKVEATLKSIQEAQTIGELTSVKKMKGHKSAYRIRIGDYRLGFFAEGKSITLVRVMHRNKIYDYFP